MPRSGAGVAAAGVERGELADEGPSGARSGEAETGEATTRGAVTGGAGSGAGTGGTTGARAGRPLPGAETSADRGLPDGLGSPADLEGPIGFEEPTDFEETELDENGRLGIARCAFREVSPTTLRGLGMAQDITAGAEGREPMRIP